MESTDWMRRLYIESDKEYGFIRIKLFEFRL